MINQEKILAIHFKSRFYKRTEDENYNKEQDLAKENALLCVEELMEYLSYLKETKLGLKHSSYVRELEKLNKIKRNIQNL